MNIRLFLSSLTLMLFALLAGGSAEKMAISIVIGVLGTIIVSIIVSIVKDNNKNKRLKIIKKDEEQSTDFDRSVFIGDDRCKLYFDNNKKQVMIMRVMTEGVKKEYIDDFEFPGKELALYSNPAFNVYDVSKRKLLSGTYNDLNIVYEITDLGEKDNNKTVSVNTSINPQFNTLTWNDASDAMTKKKTVVLLDESHGQIAISETGKIVDVFNYINSDVISKKEGGSTTSVKKVGNYLFITDDFFKLLVVVSPKSHEIFNFADIIDVSYEENGDVLFSKSASRTVGGAIVGGVLMGGAGAVVGGLSGDTKQKKEVRSMDIKILLRSTTKTSYVLHFLECGSLTVKDDGSRQLYESYQKNANEAKDLLCVIIDNVKQDNHNVEEAQESSIINSSWSIADELAKLAKLKESGILTEEEFNTQKARLLNS